MNLSSASFFDAIRCANLHVIRLLLTDRQMAREYCSAALRHYDELMRHGLPRKNPIEFMYRRGWAPRILDERIELPVGLHSGGGTRLEEFATLAMVTKVLRPSKVFEIGTFRGATTSVFRLNAPASATVVTLDLPQDAAPALATGSIDTDLELIQQRDVGVVLRQTGLHRQCEQVFCDSLEFDPSPHRGSVELGFIDGAHSALYVENDTRKMATMMAPRGLVFWHDYGGKGRFRELTAYLDGLRRRTDIYRVWGTTLAWTTAEDLRKAM